MPNTQAQTGAATDDSDAVAVAELISDIEAELRLHLMRVQEFLDGTGESPAVTDEAEKDRLMRLSQHLRGCIEDIGALA